MEEFKAAQEAPGNAATKPVSSKPDTMSFACASTLLICIAREELTWSTTALTAKISCCNYNASKELEPDVTELGVAELDVTELEVVMADVPT